MPSSYISSWDNVPRRPGGGAPRRLKAAEIEQLMPVLKVGLVGRESQLSPRSQRPQTAKSLRMLGSSYTAALMSLESSSSDAKPHRPFSAIVSSSSRSATINNNIPRPPSSRPSTAGQQAGGRATSSRRMDDEAIGITRDDTDDVRDDEIDAAFASQMKPSRSAGRRRPWAEPVAPRLSAQSQRSSSRTATRRPMSAASERTCSGGAGISTPRVQAAASAGQLGLENTVGHPTFYSSYKHSSIDKYLSETKKLVFSNSVDRMRQYVRDHQNALEMAKVQPPEIPPVEEYTRNTAAEKRQRLLETLQRELLRRNEEWASPGGKGGRGAPNEKDPQQGALNESQAHAIISRRLQESSVRRLHSQAPTTLIAKKIKKDFFFGHPLRPGSSAGK